MSKYRVHLGSFVTKLMKRKFVVSASSRAEALEKAEDLFRKACQRHVYTECGETIECDGIELISQ